MPYMQVPTMTEWSSRAASIPTSTVYVFALVMILAHFNLDYLGLRSSQNQSRHSAQSGTWSFAVIEHVH